jgi:O-antigen/teichoic acid export membrane protein
MKGRFFRDGLIYGGATLLTGLSNVVLVSVYTRTIDRSAYGAVEYINVLQLLIQLIVGFELTQGIARFYGGTAAEAERREYASTGFWTLVVAYGVACAALFVAADGVQASLLGDAVPLGILRPALVSVYVAIMFYVVRSQLRWELRAARYALASLIAAMSVVGLSVYLLLVLRTGVIGVFVATGVGYGLGLGSCLYGLRRTYSWSFNVHKLKTMLRFSAPLTLSALALFAANYGDRFVIRAAMGFDDLGVYAAGGRVASVIALASAGFQLGAAPLIYRHYRQPETPATLAQLLRIFMAAGLIGVLALAAFSPELVAVFATPAYAGAARIVPLLALATILASGYIFLPGLTVNNMTSRFAAINIAAAAISLVFIAVLAQAHGVVGAAAGALSGASVGLGLHAFYSQRVYRLPVDWWRIVAGLGLAIAAIAFGWSLDRPEPTLLLGRITAFLVSGTGVAMLMLNAADRAMIRDLLATPLTPSRPSIES